jgi:hypothetical protein
MSETHTLNKAKIEAELLKRGWKRDERGDWLTPAIYSREQAERDWTECLLSGVVCDLEEKKKDTEEFLKKHPTAKR